MEPIYIYTDGACSGNPGAGGYGVVLIYGSHRRELSAGYRLTTNNRMELLAVIEALGYIVDRNKDVIITSDSRYVCDAINKGWLQNWINKGEVKYRPNGDLWVHLDKLMKSFSGGIQFQWIKGHSGHPENERCDQLAVRARNNPNYIDHNFEAVIC